MCEGQLEMPTQGCAGSSGLTGGDRALVSLLLQQIPWSSYQTNRTHPAVYFPYH
jgi:hypothetical protein